MSRSSGYTGKSANQREALENAMAALVRVRYLSPITLLRVRQARERSGLSDLLTPALHELDEQYQLVRAAQEQVSQAIRGLTDEQ